MGDKRLNARVWAGDWIARRGGLVGEGLLLDEEGWVRVSPGELGGRVFLGENGLEECRDVCLDNVSLGRVV